QAGPAALGPARQLLPAPLRQPPVDLGQGRLGQVVVVVAQGGLGAGQQVGQRVPVPGPPLVVLVRAVPPLGPPLGRLVVHVPTGRAADGQQQADRSGQGQLDPPPL